jgi:acetyl esterase
VALSPQARALLERIEALGDPPLEESTPDEVRALRAARIRPSRIALHEIRDVDCDGVPGRLYRPSGDEGLGLFVYLHGGGWVLGSLDTHDDVTRRLAAASGHAVLAVDYRLAPEHPFPAGLEDAFTTVRWAHGAARQLDCDPGRIAIGGDSSGANLAAVVAQHRPVPLRFQLLVYPVTDARCRSGSYRTFAEGPWLTRTGMEWFLGHYLSGGDASRDDPRVSPLLADDALLAASPPMFLLTASDDVLRDEGEAYAERLREAGVAVEVRRVEGVFHGFCSFADLLDDGARALEECGAAIARALDTA